MAFTVVQSKIGVVALPGAATIAVSFDTLPAVGGLIIVVGASINGVAGTITATDNQGNTYTRDVDFGATAAGMAILSAPVVTSSGTFTVTVADTSNNLVRAVIIELSAGTASPFDVSSTGSAFDSAPDTGVTAATAQNDEIAIAAVFGVLGSSWTPNLGYTTMQADDTDLRPFNCSYKILSAVGTQQETWTNDGNTIRWAAVLGTYKAAAAAIGSNTFQMSSIS